MKPAAARRSTRRAPRSIAAVVVAGVLLAGCGGGASTTDTPAATSSAGPAETSSSAGGTAGKVSANNASVAELQAAFEAAGISNARQWAREVEEYRPYDTDDADLTHLRDELAKYNPAAGVVDSIVATLSLP